MKSRRKARFVTSQYHNIRNEMAAIDNDRLLPVSDKDDQKRVLNQKLEAIGGVNKYQQASIISTSHFKTSKWVVGMLEQLGCRKSLTAECDVEKLSAAACDSENAVLSLPKNKVPASKLNVLEVGAINVQLQQCQWLNVRAIDVNSQHPSIEECDFFDITPTSGYDAVVCSMVSATLIIVHLLSFIISQQQFLI